MAARKSKAIATWLALAAGVWGAHRFYLHGVRDAWAWLHAVPTLAGLLGLRRLQTLGVDDRLSWLLLPLLGLMLAQACLAAIVYGLTPDATWAERRQQPLVPTAWGPILGVIAALMVGATALMATIAFAGQRFFEWQLG
jgi:hypothetical protein